MRKIFSVAVAVICLFAVLPAQAQLKFGLKGGLNISKVTFSKDVVKGDNQTGFFVGPMAEFTFPVIGLGIDAAALYNQFEAQVNNASESYSQTMKSIEIPVNLKWTFGLGSTFGVFVAAGPQFGFNVGKGRFAEDFDINGCYTTFNVGAGLKLLRHLQLGANYNFGITKLAKAMVDVNEGPDADIEMKRNTWQISLAYMF